MLKKIDKTPGRFTSFIFGGGGHGLQGACRLKYRVNINEYSLDLGVYCLTFVWCTVCAVKLNPNVVDL